MCIDRLVHRHILACIRRQKWHKLIVIFIKRQKVAYLNKIFIVTSTKKILIDEVPIPRQKHPLFHQTYIHLSAAQLFFLVWFYH